MQNKKLMTFAESINSALKTTMTKNKKVLLIGLGVDDPKKIFGTTKNLTDKSLKNRIFDMPTAENSMMGIGIGLAIQGFRPVISHQRVEFSLLAMEQIINQAAKWRYMFAGKMKVPLVLRLIIGKGWGQGPQHSQSLESIFAHIPGLKIVSPSNPYDAKGLLISSIEDNNPVIFFEHRWLHQIKNYVPKKYYKVPLGKAKVLLKGKDLTIVSNSIMSYEALSLKNIFYGSKIFPEIIDLRCLRPLDKNSILKSVKKTKRLLVLDNGWAKYGISSEIIALVSENSSIKLKTKPVRLGLNDSPIPSTRALARYSYVDKKKIINTISKILNKKINLSKLKKLKLNETDVPNKDFNGPF
tara:strand:+ start:9535 stop:10599 length:1065 start_codon:yes stop_codon:yes gene_type:complete